MQYRAFFVIILLTFVFTSGATVSRGGDDPTELGQARAGYERDVEFATRPIRDRYVSRLDLLKRALGARGDARAALAVQEEMDRVKELSAQAAGKGRFEGLWTIRYDNGVVRKVSIDANDVITTLEEGNQPRNLKAKLATNGGEGLVDWGDGSIEKMTLANAKLVIEHFNPKSLYPNGPPTRRAVGVKGMAK